MTIRDGIEILTLISIPVGICVAIYGINTWRREHVGKRQLELAEDTLALFYEAADAIRPMRHAASFGNEMKDVEQQDGESNREFQARQNASVVFHRYNQHQTLFSKLHASRYRFMALIGKEEARPFDELRAITSQIRLAANVLARLWPKDYFRTKEQERKHWDNIEKHEAVFWEGSAEDDPINPRLDKAIADMDATCKSIIIGKGTLHGFLNKKLWKRSK